MWIKICGITSLEDAELAIAAGADAIGFVFAESPRRVAPQTVREIVKLLPQSVEKIGVFVDAELNVAAAICQLAGLTGVQIHRSNTRKGISDKLADTNRISRFRVLRVVRHDGNSERFALNLRQMRENGLINEQDAILIDTCIEGKQGGTGQTFDWSAARTNFLEEAPHLRLIAAGGLRPENVAQAIEILQPWGVDVSSGVEASPGKKDAARIAAFVQEARRASHSERHQGG